MNVSQTKGVVLVVEDEWLVRDALATALVDAGWHVVEADTAEKAIAQLATEGDRITLVFTDIQLAGDLSGWDVAEAARAGHPRVPIIFTSGSQIDQSRLVPNSQFVSKPYDTNIVLEALAVIAGGAPKSIGGDQI